VLGLFTVGLLAGGVLSSFVLWLLSGLAAPIPPGWRYASIVAVALLGLLRDAGAVRFPLPQNTRQVPQDVLQRSLTGGALQFGFELGTGVRTYVSSTAPYVVAIGLVLAAPGLPVALLTGAGFGLGRAATPLARFLSGTGDAWDARLHTLIRAITVGGCAAILLFLVPLALTA
jgi:hypothetical protein